MERPRNKDTIKSFEYNGFNFLYLPWGTQDYDEITPHCDFNNF